MSRGTKTTLRQFVYHPETGVYYHPASRTYVWENQHGLASGDTLPSYMELYHEDADVVFLREDDPVYAHLFTSNLGDTHFGDASTDSTF